MLVVEFSVPSNRARQTITSLKMEKTPARTLSFLDRLSGGCRILGASGTGGPSLNRGRDFEVSPAS
ncbi:MAG: hypothetical protein JWO91_937 [Acidobacteriaceae bacterium]|jgi:hypothetical protein|nr:hypothetical protein [Acidobacteriaceae bacterium]